MARKAYYYVVLDARLPVNRWNALQDGFKCDWQKTALSIAHARAQEGHAQHVLKVATKVNGAVKLIATMGPGK